MQKMVGAMILATAATSVMSDTRVQSGGQECWMNDAGHVYGCVNTRPAVDTQGQVYAPAGQGYVRPQEGRYYAPAGSGRAPSATFIVDPQTGRLIQIQR